MTDVRHTWAELPLAARSAIACLAVLDVALRGWALVDLTRRPETLINGSKGAWGTALLLVSSGGVLPAAYLRRGRLHRP